MDTTTVAAAKQPKGESTRVDEPKKPKESFRDFLEQFVAAIILAILIRAFDAEAFVIPTGSMAPTLMGRHKEVVCPQCGYQYAVNSSDDTQLFARQRDLKEFGICVNCRYRTDIDETPSFKGDRILVMKFPYDLPSWPSLAGPKRWDVVVFHYPFNPETNYIKRTVGLPAEDLRLVHGDVQTRPAGTTESFRIERKPMIHQDAMQMMVFDDRHRPAALADKPEWARWVGPAAWKETTPASYQVDATTDKEWSDLAYHHRVPDPEQWRAVERKMTMPRPPRSTLITDFYSYNSNISPDPYDLWLQSNDGYLQSNWVGDLTVSTTLDVEAAEPGAKVHCKLVEAGVVHRAEVDLDTGVASIYRGDVKLGEAPTPFKGAGSHLITFANVDDRLTLRVDGQAPFGDGLNYDIDPIAVYAPTALDLEPASVGVKGAKLTATDLVLTRDIYYTQDPRGPDYKIPGVHDSSDRDPSGGADRVTRMYDFLADPAKYAALKDLSARESFSIRPGHYMMMGDNSPRSADSRVWYGTESWRPAERSTWEVPTSLLIGKAFFVYWPHGKPFGPDIQLNRDIRIPFRPYVERMKWIR